MTETWSTEDGKLLPKKGVYTKTAGELVQELTKYKDDIGFVLVIIMNKQEPGFGSIRSMDKGSRMIM
ncbi:hypothetical protein [Dolosigranulum pigrum]|uniref:hypothetical protein n=1 Tax=Dolosigranulum pigrum TaxID=29394 RepID=UPI001FCC6CFB|nr:hypothetical protein [Dolosigranulum pigrum]